MSNIIPPLLCDSPPPLNVEDEDDDFGDFTTARDLSYPGEALSLPTTPHHIPSCNVSYTNPIQDDYLPPISSDETEVNIKPNCESSETKMCNGHSEIIDSNSFINKNVGKDHQDKRKCDTPEIISEIEPNVIETIVENVDNSDNSTDNSKNSAYVLDTTDVEDPESCETKSFSSGTDCSENNVVNNIPNDDISTSTDIKFDYVDDEDDFQEFQEESKEELSCEDKPEDDLKCSEDVVVLDNDVEEIIQEELEEENWQEEIEKQNLQQEVENQNLQQEFEDDNLQPEFQKQNLQQEVENQNLQEEINKEECKQDDIEFDVDFDDFQASVRGNDTINQIPSIENIPEVCENQDDDDDDDDFGDFDDYSTQVQPASISSAPMILNSEETYVKATKIIIDLFPPEEKSENDFEVVDFVTENSIFKGVKDIELTNALTYQWATSESQKMLLKSLNIDRRNILYGPAWNPSMPRFAANLSFAPLEPIKSELPASNQSPSVPAEQNLAASTDAQFDWTGTEAANINNSLLINSALLLDLEQIVSSLDIAHSPICTNAHSPIDNDSWDMWLQSLSPTEDEQQATMTTNVHLKPISLTDVTEELSANSVPVNEQDTDVSQPTQSTFSVPQGDNESVKSLKFSDLAAEPESQKDTSDDYDEFTSYKSASDSYSSWSSTSVPLRETHISNGATMHSARVRRCEETTAAEDKTIPFTETQTKLEEDDFTAFQMSNALPVAKPADAVPPQLLPTAVPLEPLKPTVLPSAPTKIEWPEPGIANDDISNLELSLVTLKSASPTDSTSAPSPTQYPTPGIAPMQSSPVKQAPPTDQTEIEGSAMKNIPNRVPEAVTKKPVEEDDWTDFVSNQDVKSGSSQHRNHQYLLNGGGRKSMEISPPPQFQQFSVSRPPPQLNMFDAISPTRSVSAHLYGAAADRKSNDAFVGPPPIDDPLEQFNKIHRQPPSASPHAKQAKSAQSHRGGNNESDDDWTEFVSSPAASNGWSGNRQQPPQLPPPTHHPHHHQQQQQPQQLLHRKANFDWNKPPQFTSWSTNITPNIITNPVHFDLLPNCYSQPSSSSGSDIFKTRSSAAAGAAAAQKKPASTVASNKTNIPSISAMPDLDFIAPRTRTFPKK